MPYCNWNTGELHFWEDLYFACTFRIARWRGFAECKRKKALKAYCLNGGLMLFNLRYNIPTPNINTVSFFMAYNKGREMMVGSKDIKQVTHVLRILTLTLLFLDLWQIRAWPKAAGQNPKYELRSLLVKRYIQPCSWSDGRSTVC